MVIKGVVAPNRVGFDATTIEHIRVLGIRRLQVLIYDEATLADQIIDMLAVQAAIPGIEFVIRFYAGNIITFGAGEWARSRRRLLNKIMAAGVRVVGMLSGNEFNIEVPADRPELASDWAYQVKWLKDFADAWFEAEGPHVDVHRPALSPCVPGWTDGEQAYADGGLGAYFNIHDSHCYRGTERAYEEIRSRFPGCRFAITEFNGIDPESYLPSLPEDIEDAYYFSLKWVNPPEGAENVDLIGSAFYESFARAATGESNSADGLLRPSGDILELQDSHNGGETVEEEYSVGPGMFEAMDSKGDAPAEDEHYVGDRESFCAGEKGLYIYSKGANRVAWIPWAD